MIRNFNSIRNDLDDIFEHGQEYHKNDIAMIACALDTDSGECVRGGFGKGEHMIFALSLLASSFIEEWAESEKKSLKKARNEFLSDFCNSLDQVLEESSN